MVKMSLVMCVVICVWVVFFFFFIQRAHFLTALLLLELIGIFLVFVIPVSGVFCGQNYSMIVIIILTMRACEARLGLAIIVFIVRSYGNDFLSSISVRAY